MKTNIQIFILLAIILFLNGCSGASRPSEVEIHSLFISAMSDRYALKDEDIYKIEFGDTIVSQGGQFEMSVGAPKGTKIFQVKIYYHNPDRENKFSLRWMFKDSFGEWKCSNTPY